MKRRFASGRRCGLGEKKRFGIGVSWSVHLRARAAFINTEDGQRQRISCQRATTVSSLGPGQQGVVSILGPFNQAALDWRPVERGIYQRAACRGVRDQYRPIQSALTQ